MVSYKDSLVFGFIFLATTALVSLSSCKKESDNTANGVATTAAKPIFPLVSRSDRWSGSVQSCQLNATPDEKTKYGENLPTFCACIADFMITACAKSDDQPTQEVADCLMNLDGNVVQTTGDNCLKKGRPGGMKNPFKT